MSHIELKDYFAGQALQGLLISNPSIDITHLILTSYHIADKMLQEKNNSESPKTIINSKQIQIT